MNIYLSANNRKEVIKIPIIPSELKVGVDSKVVTVETARHGDLNVIGKKGLRNISFSSFFPSKQNKYSFTKDNSTDAYGYVKTINNWMSKGYTVRLLIPNFLNVEFAINSFEYGVQDGSGDFYYTIEMSEFKRIRVK